MNYHEKHSRVKYSGAYLKVAVSLTFSDELLVFACCDRTAY